MNTDSLFYAIDEGVLLFINHLSHAPLFNIPGLLLSAGSGFIWFFLIGIIYTFYNRKQGIMMVAALLLAAVLSWVIVAFGIKPLIARPRPDITQPSVISIKNYFDSALPYVIGNDSNSFPSGHATIAFAGAFILIKYIPKKTWVWIILASLIGISRIYLGKHYPSDVVAGTFLGLGIGWVTLKIVHWLSHTQQTSYRHKLR